MTIKFVWVITPKTYELSLRACLGQTRIAIYGDRFGCTNRVAMSLLNSIRYVGLLTPTPASKTILPPNQPETANRQRPMKESTIGIVRFDVAACLM